ncbi:MAG: HAD-IA family hydrolase [Acetobacteraceae bacterium]
MTTLRLVIFDCDGVLIDSEPVCNRVVAEALTRLGWPMTAEICEQRFVGMSFHDMQPVVEARLGRALPASWIADLATDVARTMETEAVVVPGAKAAIRAVASLGLDWRVASNSSHQEMAAKFGCTGLAGLVAGRLHSSEDAIAEGGRGKPAPDVFLRAARSAGIEPAACLVIEDSAHGARAAKAAGMECLGFCPNGDGALLAAEGAVLFHSLADLPGLLRARL